jgi:hypothetical protein
VNLRNWDWSVIVKIKGKLWYWDSSLINLAAAWAAALDFRGILLMAVVVLRCANGGGSCFATGKGLSV